MVIEIEENEENTLTLAMIRALISRETKDSIIGDPSDNYAAGVRRGGLLLAEKVARLLNIKALEKV